MPCYHPVPAWQVGEAPVVFWAVQGGRRLNVPCGQCSGCRLRRARHWATRCIHESQLHAVSCFLTLTYRDPCPVSLRYRDFQLFMKRLRKSLKVPVRFFACGEYGEETFRPHFHACLFGVDFLDKKFHKKGDSGESLFISAKADALWGHGNVWIGSVTFQSASYVARYVMKKVTGDQAEFYYTVVDPVSGELLPVEPEFVHMSLKPGIGAGWLERFGSDVFPSGEVVVNGKKSAAPRYYDLWYEKRDPEGMQAIKDRRFLVVAKRWERSFLALQRRLAAGELIDAARTNLFKREV